MLVKYLCNDGSEYSDEDVGVEGKHETVVDNMSLTKFSHNHDDSE